jgi:general secretion pathway protein D/MSHA biogenesis protein MshL
VTQDFSTAIGGNLLGSGETKGMMRGEVQVINKFKEPMDFWKMIEDNLKKILGPEQAGVFMLIDRPLGIITVTAPNSTHEKVETYLKNIKKELFRQVIIEAKIIEVILNKSSQMGIDWSNLAKTTLTGRIGQGGILYFKRNIIDQVTFNALDFNLILGALANYGETRVLSSPRVTLMNGQTATLTVGENIRFIDKVETTANTQTQTVSYSVSTSSILSGVGVAVLANILNQEEVVLYIVPITSELREPIEYMTFGGTQTGSQVGLPRVKLKEMSTFARLRQGEALLIGGLIDKNQLKSETKVPILSSIPLLGNLFRYESTQDVNRELVIMLKPKIIDYSEN